MDHRQLASASDRKRKDALLGKKRRAEKRAIRVKKDRFNFDTASALQNFVGKQIRLVNNWFKHVDVSHFEKKTTRYLEIGALHGANFISFLKT